MTKSPDQTTAELLLVEWFVLFLRVKSHPLHQSEALCCYQLVEHVLTKSDWPALTDGVLSKLCLLNMKANVGIVCWKTPSRRALGFISKQNIPLFNWKQFTQSLLALTINSDFKRHHTNFVCCCCGYLFFICFYKQKKKRVSLCSSTKSSRLWTNPSFSLQSKETHTWGLQAILFKNWITHVHRN